MLHKLYFLEEEVCPTHPLESTVYVSPDGDRVTQASMFELKNTIIKKENNNFIITSLAL